MGCDIHLHIEIKINNEWHHYNHPNGLYAGTENRRNYKLFAKMAGVRNYEPLVPICQPKGLPEDITFITRFDWSKDNYHDESWFNLEEIRELNEWWEEQPEFNPQNPESHFEEYFGYLFGNVHCEETLKLNNIQDVRFVFWFDN